MHKFMRYIRQNKKQIIKVAMIVAFLFGILQLLNYLAKNDYEISVGEKEDIYKTSKGTILTEKSAVSGRKVSTNEIKKVSNKIEEFVKYCNENKAEEAYNLLSDSCKEEAYPTLESFMTFYYEPLFKDGAKTYTIQNWVRNTYLVKFTGDLLATGRPTSNFSYQDYITIEEDNDGEKKLNINKYIGKQEINEIVSKNDIQLKVLYSSQYMDYEEYVIEATNNTKDTILLDQLLYTDTIYLMDGNDTKHISYSNEIVKDDLLIYEGHTKTIRIKFDNPYISDRKIKKICFSDIVLNYDKNNKAGFEKLKIFVNI